MSDTIKGLELSINLNTEEIDRSIGDEILNNLKEDINDLIRQYYNTYNKQCVIKSKLIHKDMSIDGFKVGDKVKVVKIIDEESKVNIGSIGEIIDTDDFDNFPIRCNFHNEKDYGFKPQELEIIY